MLHPQVPSDEYHPLCQVLVLVRVILIPKEPVEHVALEVFQQVDLVIEFAGIGINRVIGSDTLYCLAL
jgi:hypothetical protein